MKISARNQFTGRITALKEGPVSAEVELTTPGGDRIVASVTDSSVRSLGLAIGKEAVAIVKAPWVALLTDASGYRFTARNQLQGSVAAIVPGAVNAHVKVSLAGGTTIGAIVTADAVAELGLAVGTPVTALIKASHVLLGVRD